MARDIEAKIKLNGQEMEDIISAIHFFNDSFPDKPGSKVTRREMMKLAKKIKRIIWARPKSAGDE